MKVQIEATVLQTFMNVLKANIGEDPRNLDTQLWDMIIYVN